MKIIKILLGTIIAVTCISISTKQVNADGFYSPDYYVAKESYDNAVSLESQGAIGFYKSQYGFTDDMINLVLNDCLLDAEGTYSHRYSEYTDIGADGDATSIENLKNAIGLLKVFRNLREINGLAMPDISIYQMLYAEVSANYSDWNFWDNGYGMNHPITPYGENIAAGYAYNRNDPNSTGPYSGWYYDEKKVYEYCRDILGFSGDKLTHSYIVSLPYADKLKIANDIGLNNTACVQTGHYQQIINGNYTTTGVAYTDGSAAAQEFYYTNSVNGPFYRSGLGYSVTLKDTLVSLDQLENDLNSYLNYIQQQKEAFLEYCTEMYRIYNPNSGEHFYTSNVDEKNHLVSLGWRYEGVGWIAPKNSSIPVYRLYNKNGGEHHYTMNASEKDMLVSKGWKYEGIGWYSADPNDASSVPVLREYNPNAFANNHNYTKNVKEHNMLMRVGWKDEGKAWYSIQ